MAELLCWDLFKATVEGRESPASSVLHDGRPIYCAHGIPQGSPPNLQILAEFLRSETQIPSGIRSWLADMMDRDANSEFQFKKLSKRKRGAKARGSTANWEAARYVQALLSENETRKRAIGSAEEKFGIKRSAIEAALKSLREADEEHAKWNRQQEMSERESSN